jgi:beta-phosphoglucomutase
MPSITGRNKRFKAVIFDLDGVITNTMPDHFRAWSRVFREAGLHVTRLDIYRREGQPGRQSVKEIFADYNLPFDPARADMMLERKEALFKEIVRGRFINGARSFLKEMKRRGFRLALVTGTARHEMMKVLPERVRAFFEAMVTGNDVKHGKPHPEPYLKALKALNISPYDALVIENAPFGIRSAKQARIECVALATSLPEAYLREADGIFKTYRDLIRHPGLQSGVEP